MKQNVAQVDLVIPVKNSNATNMRFQQLTILLLFIALLSSCGSSSKMRRNSSDAPQKSTLSAQEQRRFEYYYLEAIRLKAQDEYAAAFDMLQHCLRIDPNAAPALYEISQYYLFLKMNEQAQASLEAAVANAPNNYWYAQALGNYYMQKNDAEKSIALLEDMVTRFPDRRESLFMLVDLYGRAGDNKKTISTLDKVESLLGKSEQLSMEKFRIYHQMGETKKAFEEVETLVAEYPMDFRYQVLLGDLYMQNNKPNEAYAMFQGVLKAEPDNPLAMLSLASYYEETDQPELYKQQIDKLLLEKQVPAETKMGVMQQLVMQNEQAKGDSTKIINLFNEIMALDADDDQIPMMYSQYLWSKEMYTESIPVLEQILRVDPTNKAARLMLLRVALRDNDYALVQRVCEGGIDATPDALEFYFYLAIAYNQDERLEEALAVSKKAIEQVKPDSPKEMVSDFYSIMGDIYHSQKKVDDAYASYDSALSYNPNNIGALNNYAYYLSVERRDLDKAEEMSYKTVKAEPNNATYLDTYAWILFEKGNYAEARIYIDNAMKNGGGESDVVVEHCGDIYYMTGDVEGALKYWKQALEMGNKSELLKQKIHKKKYIAE